MERLYGLWLRVAEALIIIASANSILLCLVLADQRRDVSWYLFGMAIMALLLLWVCVNREDDRQKPTDYWDD